MERHDKAEAELPLNEARLRALYELTQRRFDSEREMVEYALDEVVRLTGSKIGYFHLVSEDQVNLELFTWTKEVSATCSAPRESHYPLAAAGVWADCLRHRRPAIHNDYQDLPDRKGYPEGHTPIIRHLSVPIFDSDQVVIIIGVGNKETPYDDDDVLQAQLFMNEVWKTILKRRADQALRESENRYRAVIETSPDAIVVTDLEVRIVMVNQQGLKMFGYDDRSEVIGRMGFDLLPPDHLERAGATLRKILAGGGNEPVEFDLQRRDGSRFPTLMRSSVLSDAGGKAVGIITFIHDLTERKRAEEARRESEALYRLIADNISETVWLMDLDLQTTYISPSVIRLRGFSIEEVKAMTLEQELTPASLQRARQAAAEELTPERLADASLELTRTLELEFFRKDGSTIWEEVTVSLIRDGEGRPIGILGVGRPIEKRRKAEEALRRSEELFRIAAGVATDLIFEWDRAANRMQWFGDIDRMLGYGPGEFPRSLAGAIQAVHPDDIGLIQQALAGYFNQGDSFDLEYQLRKKDGSYLDILSRGQAVRDDAGELVKWIGVNADITRRKRMESRLREIEERYRSLFDRSLEIVFVIDFEGNFLDANPAALDLFGYSLEEARGINFTSLLDKTQRKLALATLETVAQGTNSGISVFQLRTRDGRLVTLEAKGSLLLKDGRPYAIQGIARDITDRVELEEKLKAYHAELELKVAERTRELENAQEELIRKERLAVLGQLAGSVGHEILNPLGAINNASYFLQKVLKDPDDKVKKHLSIIDREVSRSKKIITDLLSLTRTAPRQRIAVDFPRLLEEALAEAAIPDGIKVVRSCEASLPQLELDPTQIKLALVNILINARQALEQSGTSPRIKVSLISEGAGGIRFGCEDNGPGIPPELLPRIFEPLVSTKTIGFGLGLTVCRQMAYINGGEVEAENLPSGGALFTLTFNPGPGIDNA